MKSRERDSVSAPAADYTMHFQSSKGNKVEFNNRFRSAATMIKNVVTLEGGTNAFMNKDEWVEECKAGVKYWVNKVTGEVSTHCPWRDPIETAVKRYKVAKRGVFNSGPDGELGTGSLVYDSTEVHELFELLDKAK
jgi:hypothetical protein